jgi:hypothetical protein
MHQYITDTSFAAKGLISLMTKDANRLAELVAKQQAAAAKVKVFNMEFMQREMDQSANYWHAKLHEAAQERDEVNIEIVFLEAQIRDKQVSLAVLAGALLQIGKQGISAVHSGLAKCNDGRLVRSFALKRIVWAGRNQAQHFETPSSMNDSTQQLFIELNVYDPTNPQLDPKSKRNLGFDVALMLGWNSYTQYKNDMVSLLG